MPKPKTSKKLGNSLKNTPSKKKAFSLSDMKSVKLKKNVKLLDDDSFETLQDPQKVQEGLLACIRDNDMDAFREILGTHLELINISVFSEKTGIPRQTIYRMLKPDSNPTMNTVSTVIAALVA